MPNRIDRLTPEQTARMSSFAQEWIEQGWRTCPLTEDEWAVQAEGMRRCYEYAGISWHGNVVRVSSPVVGALAAPIAAMLISVWKRDDAVHSAVDGAVSGAVGGAVNSAVHSAAHSAVHSAVSDAVSDAVDGAVGGAVDGAVNSAVHNAVHSAVSDAVNSAVSSAVNSAVHSAIHSAIHSAVSGAIHSAVSGAVHSAAHSAIHSAVSDAVDGAVGDAVRRLWFCRLGGRLWPWWQAYLAYFRDVAELQLRGDLWDRSRAYDDAQSAGWWWPFRDFAIVCDIPTELHLEQIQPIGWASHRLHCETGPAVAWSDGWGVYAWHGVQVPADLITHGWDTARILREPNAEVRRCAIERLGWDRFIADAGLQRVGSAVPDPGNPGHELALYDVPEQIYDSPVRVLLCSNATSERDGTRRRFGLIVPATFWDPVAAAGWTFGLGPAEYQALERAS